MKKFNKDVQIERLLDLEDSVGYSGSDLRQSLANLNDALYFSKKDSIPKTYKNTIISTQKQVKKLIKKLDDLAEEITNNKLFDNE